MAEQIPPPAKGMSPQQYYSFLTTKGVPAWQAYDATTAAYGQPRDPNAPPLPPSQANQWGQVAGMVGGSMLGSEIVRGFPNVKDIFKGSGKAETASQVADLASSESPTLATPDLLGGADILPGAEGGTSMLSSAGSVALPAAAIIAGASETWEGGGKDIVRGRANKQDWANMGVNSILGVGPNLVSRWLGKPSIGRRLTSGKSDDQLLRDDFRGDLKASGIADDDYNVTLADGSKFNIGKDGKATLVNSDGTTERRYWNVDESNPLAQYAITKIDPIIRAKYTAEAEQAGYKPEQYTAMIVNAVTSNAKSQADVDANIKAIYGDSSAPDESKPQVGAQPQQPQIPTQPQQSGMQKLPAPMPSNITPDQLGGIVSNSPSFQSKQVSQQGLTPEQNQMVQDLIDRLRNQGR